MNVKDLKLTPAQWLSLLQRYGVPESALTGQAAPCPICGGTDRFTYDNKRGRGDWVCRKCDNGDPMAGDGLKLICGVTGMSFCELMVELEGGSLNDARAAAHKVRAAAPAARRKADPVFVERRLTSMWGSALEQTDGDLTRRYLQARVPGLTAPPSKALRLGMLEYRHEKKVIGTWPGILARFELPDGRLGTLHRTFLERSRPEKAKIISVAGEILDNKLNDMTLNPLRGGAVRLMNPVNGEIGVAEGLESAYGGYMESGVPVWNCLNRILLSQFVVPEGLGIRVVHIFVDFDQVDPKTGKSPGVAAGVELASRLKKEGYVVFLHRPKVRGTDFCNQWFDRFVSGGGSGIVPRKSAGGVRQALAA
ncbi:primase-helicase zinc-binding domain-containing protein [Paraburkholderia sediminicola]|uniref:primase-helicase zinc-binding domain-containing protein n=1 Tax=Paraburkholderia sediminicola TaxID=458836 RepID=UPI0038B8AE32